MVASSTSRSFSFTGPDDGDRRPCFIIAEAGVNHNGDMKMARSMIDAARDAGADAVKFQTFQASKLCVLDAPKANYQVMNCDVKDETQYDMLERLTLSKEDHVELVKHCRDVGILFLSSPFDEESVDFLQSLDVSAIKIGSGELTNKILLERAGNTRKPIILSTGMGTLDEVGAAIHILKNNGCTELVVLQCTTQYPTPLEQVNLRAMQTIMHTYNVPVGFSDHSHGSQAAQLSVALGGCVVEKHFTMDKKLPGPDHKASLDIPELHTFIQDIRRAEAMLGTGEKIPMDCEKPNMLMARKSIAWNRKVTKGEKITHDMITALRPATGISPMEYNRILGKTIQQDRSASTLVSEEDIQ